MTTRRELLDYAKEHGWIETPETRELAARLSISRQMETGSMVGLWIEFTETGRIDYAEHRVNQGSPARLRGGATIIKRYIRWNGSRR